MHRRNLKFSQTRKQRAKHQTIWNIKQSNSKEEDNCQKVSPNNRKMDKTTVLKTSIGFLRQHNEMSIRSQVLSIFHMIKSKFGTFVVIHCNVIISEAWNVLNLIHLNSLSRLRRSKQTGNQCFYQMRNSGELLICQSIYHWLSSVSWKPCSWQQLSKIFYKIKWWSFRFLTAFSPRDNITDVTLVSEDDKHKS